jgi:uncharacterized membrane protein
VEVGKVSSTVKWVIVGVCAVLGVIALIYAVIYVAVGIHSLPAFVPGQVAHVNGHYHKRALLCAVIGVVLLAIAAMVGISARRTTTTATTGTGLGSTSAGTPREPLPDHAATEEAGGELPS